MTFQLPFAIPTITVNRSFIEQNLKKFKWEKIECQLDKKVTYGWIPDIVSFWAKVSNIQLPDIGLQLRARQVTTYLFDPGRLNTSNSKKGGRRLKNWIVYESFSNQQSASELSVPYFVCDVGKVINCSSKFLESIITF